MRRRARALVAAACLGVSGSGLGLWAAALPLGGGSGARAVAAADQVGGLAQAFAAGWVVDDTTAAWLTDLRASVMELNLRRAWERFPAEEGPRHTVYARGENGVSKGYVLSLGAEAAPRPRDFGDARGSASLTPQRHEEASAYRVDGTASMATASVGAAEVRGVVVAGLQALVAAAGTDPATADERVRARLRSDFPATISSLERWMVFDRFVRIGEDGVMEVDLEAHADIAALERHGFAALARFVRRMGDLAELSVAVHSRHGHLGTVWVRSPARYGLRFHLQDDALLPSSGGRTVPEHAVSLTEVTSLDLAMRPTGIIRLQGTKLSVQNWIVPLSFRETPSQTGFWATVSTQPTVDFGSDGGVEGFVVAGAGHALGLEAQAARFFAAMAAGPTGKGSTASVSMTHAPGSHLDGAADGLLLDNAVVRFAADVTAKRLVPEDDVLDDLLRLQGETMAALVRDWERARPLVATAEAAP